MAAPDSTRIIHNGGTRAAIYVGAAIVLAAGVIATLISIGLLSHEQIDAWLQSVVTIVTGLVGTGALILAALNRAGSDPTDRHHADPLNDVPSGSTDFARHEHE